jgi:hypothetical protein
MSRYLVPMFDHVHVIASSSLQVLLRTDSVFKPAVLRLYDAYARIYIL